jgi:hypothetical protein
MDPTGHNELRGGYDMQIGPKDRTVVGLKSELVSGP